MLTLPHSSPMLSYHRTVGFFWFSINLILLFLAGDLISIKIGKVLSLSPHKIINIDSKPNSADIEAAVGAASGVAICPKIDHEGIYYFILHGRLNNKYRHEYHQKRTFDL